MGALPRFMSTFQFQPAPVADKSAVHNAVAGLAGGVAKLASDKIEQEKEIALQANKYQTGADISITADQMYNNTRKNLDGQASLQQFMHGYTNYSQQTLSNTPKANQPYVASILQTQGHKVLGQLEKDIDKQNTDRKVEAFQGTFDTYFNQMSNFAREGNRGAALKYAGDIQNQVEGLESIGAMTPNQVAIYKKKTRDEVHLQDALGGFQRSLTAGGEAPSKYIDGFLSNKTIDKQFSAPEKDKIVSQMMTMKNQHLQSQGITDQSMNQAIKGNLVQMENGGDVNQDLLASIEQNFPDKLESFKKQAGDAIQVGSAMTAMKYASPTERESIVTQLHPDDPNNPDFPSQKAVSNKVMQISTNQLSALKNDSAAYVADNDAITKTDGTWSDFQNLHPKESFSEIVDDGHQAGLIDPYQARINLYKQLGVPEQNFQVMTNAAANEVMADIQNKDHVGQYDQLNRLNAQFGPYTNLAWNQLSKLGLSPGMQAAVKIMPDDKQYIPQILEAFDANPKSLQENLPDTVKKVDLDTAVAKDMSDYVDTLSQFNTPGADEIAHIKDSATTVGMQLIGGKNKNVTGFLGGVDAGKAASIASGALYTNRYDIEKSAGHHYRIPKVIAKTDMVKSVVSHLQDTIKDTDFKVPSSYRPELKESKELLDKRRLLYRDERLNNIYAVTRSDDSGIIMVDKVGIPLKTQLGSFYGFRFNEFNDPDSEVNKIANIPSLFSKALSEIPSQLGTAFVGTPIGAIAGVRDAVR